MIVHQHEYMLFYSIITNLLNTLEEYESEVNDESSKMSKLPEELNNWIADFIEEVNELSEENYRHLESYMVNSVNRQVKFYKEVKLQ